MKTAVFENMRKRVWVPSTLLLLAMLILLVLPAKKVSVTQPPQPQHQPSTSLDRELPRLEPETVRVTEVAEVTVQEPVAPAPAETNEFRTISFGLAIKQFGK